MADLQVPLNNPSLASLQAFVDQRQARGTRLLGFHVFNSGAAAYVQIFDSAASVANGTVPLRNYPVGASTALDVQIQQGQFVRGFTNGILIAGSTVATSYASTASNFLIDIQSV